MSGGKVHPKSDESNVTEVVEKKECSIFRSEANQKTIGMSECEYSSKVHSDEAIHQSKNFFPTDVCEDEEKNEEVEEIEEEDEDEDDEEGFSWRTKLKNMQYLLLGCNTDALKILKPFGASHWKMLPPEVFFSVLSDSDCDTGKRHEAIESNPKESVLDIRKTVCRRLVKAVVKTNAWIITGGLNRGVDQLIGNEVKRRLANWKKISKVVLGITNLEYFAEKKNLLNNSHGSKGFASDRNQTGVSLNQHHTHFLLVDYDVTQKSSSECNLRQIVELALAKKAPYRSEKDGLDRPLIYILVGGRINSLRAVERALNNQLPVIVAMGTGGAADIISQAGSCRDDAILEYLPEIAEKLFNRLEELLIAEKIRATVIRKALNNIKAESKLKLLFEIVELLDQTRISDEGEQQFKDKISTLVKITTNELLAEIKDLLISKQTSIDDSNCSTADAESDTVNLMRLVFEQMLIVNRIPQEKAKRAVDHLEPEVLNETVTKMKLVFTGLKAIRTHDRKDLLIKFDITSKENKTISCSIVEALKKAKWNKGSDIPSILWNKESDLYMLVANWDNETFFRQLLLDNYMRCDHEDVFKELLKEGKTIYVKLMMEHVSSRKWLTKPQGPLEEVFKKNKLCQQLLKKIKDTENSTDYEDERWRLKGKMLFIWCVLKGMRETAMLFWELGEDCLAMAVVAYSESKKQMEELVNKKGYDEMEQQMQFFEKLALDFMKKCRADGTIPMLYILYYPVEDLDGISSNDIANKANFENFLCADAMQDSVNIIWVAHIINHRKWKYAALLLSEACPLLAPALLEFRKELSHGSDEKEDDKTVQKSERVRNYFSEVGIFMSTPLVKFTYRFVSYIAYLTLFSIVMLTDFRNKISPSEIALTIWTFILIIEEVRQVIRDKSGYISNGWNYFDIGALLLYIIGFILRMIYHGDPTICPDCKYVARIILAFSLMVFFFRVLQFLSIFDSTGPTIYMIRQLVADLVSILLILAVFISAYGVVSNVILYPNQPLNAQLLQDVFYDAWWSVIQQFNREDALGLNCNMDNPSAIITSEYCSSTSNDNIDYVSCKENRCPANNWIVSVILAFYALLTCIMLLNVLIAMFNATFSNTVRKQKDVSKFHRYRLVNEYDSDSIVPPPLCVITYPYVFIKYVHGLCDVTCPTLCKDKKEVENEQNNKESRISQSPHEAYKRRQKLPWHDWELGLAADFYRQNKDKDEKQRWPVARLKFGTSNKFEEKPWIKHTTRQIRNQMKEEQPREETENIDNRETDAIDATEKKGN